MATTRPSDGVSRRPCRAGHHRSRDRARGAADRAWTQSAASGPESLGFEAAAGRAVRGRDDDDLM